MDGRFSNFPAVPEEQEDLSPTESEHHFNRNISPASSYSSSSSFEAEWSGHVRDNGSLLYIESYVSSTVKERQEQAMKTLASKPVSPSKKMKHHSKLLNLLKRRPSVRVKSQTNNRESGRNATSGGAIQSPPKVTFRDNADGEVRQLHIEVTAQGNNFGRRASLCETVLGVTPGQFSEATVDKRVMVAGLIPGSQVLKDGTMKIGDWLKTINEVDVSWDNLDDTLLDIPVPSFVAVEVQKCSTETVAEEESSLQKNVTQTQLVKLLTKNELVKPQNAENDPLYCLLYLSLEGVEENSPNRADIRYQYPEETNKLIDIRGMFITANDTLGKITDTPLISLSITIHDEEFCVAFSQERKDVFLIAFPLAILSEAETISLLKQLTTLLKFEYGSLSEALANPIHKTEVDHLVSLVVDHVFTLSRDTTRIPFLSSSPREDIVPLKECLTFSAPRSLMLSDEQAMTQIENCLNELESGDFGEDESDCEDCQLMYTILGSCLFYKGSLVLSHLDTNSLQDTWLFCLHHRFLHLTAKEAVSQLVLWKRVFPVLEKGSMPLHDEVNHHLLVVAMNHVLLAMIVESGHITELLDEKDGPDPYLIDQAEATLYHLNSLHVPEACEESLFGSGIETITIDDKYVDKNISKKQRSKSVTDTPEGTRKPEFASILKQKSTETSFDFSDKDFSVTETNNFSTQEEPEFRIWKGSEGRITYQADTEWTQRTLPPIKVTVGKEKILLHLVQLDVGEGCLVTSQRRSRNPPLHRDFLNKFHECCFQVQRVLKAFQPAKDLGKYSFESPLSTAKEFGMMFTYEPGSESQSKKKKGSELTYWVIGRRYGPPYARDIYACFEDSVPQNIQEIAFKVSLGCN